MAKKKLVLIGSNGQLGTDIQKVLENNATFTLYSLTHSDIEITNPENIKKTLQTINPDIVINTAAYNKVDEAEINSQKAFFINSIAVKYLASYCQENNIILTHISTDYVFGIDKKRQTPYRETDYPGPLNSYGVSKLAGEYLISYLCKRYFIIRTSGLFGAAGSSEKKGNFIEAILKMAKERNPIKVVNDQVLTPTYTLDLAKQIVLLLKTDCYGLYHATAEGQCSWYEFAKEVFQLMGINATLEAITSNMLNAKVQRPYYSVLENEKLKKLGIHSMRDWHVCLKEYLKEKKYI